ncbi:MAG: hypothetical protein NC205_03410 [Prevotella sp.]|nr:hypothetical protein [Alistipes senegalensis]MCM1357616.1 hypothetical protein [Prevotella sp.]MCM1474106.1 hypothetical protein [Muribaculaceae bacterium]
MNGITIKNTTYRLDFSFLVFNALIFLMRENNTVMTFYAVCMIHELGHLFAIAVTGGKVKSVVFSGTGVIITPERNSRHELFIMLAGAGANIITFALMIISGIGGMFCLLNLCTAIYNLLPYRQLDGGAALCLLTDGTPYERTVNTVLTVLKLIFSVILFAAVLLYGRDFIPVFIVSVMLFISERGN